MESCEVCIKTRSTPASLPILGQVTKHTTVKWPIAYLVVFLSINFPSLHFTNIAGILPILPIFCFVAPFHPQNLIFKLTLLRTCHALKLLRQFSLVFSRCRLQLINKLSKNLNLVTRTFEIWLSIAAGSQQNKNIFHSVLIVLQSKD